MSNATKYTTNGVIHEIPDIEQVGSFEKQRLVITVPGFKEDQFVVFEFFGKSVSQCASLEVGDGVTIEWEWRGREKNGKYYSTASAWKATRTSQGRGREDRQQGRASSPDRNFARPGDEPRSRYQERPPVTTTANTQSFDEEDEIPF